MAHIEILALSLGIITVILGILLFKHHKENKELNEEIHEWERGEKKYTGTNLCSTCAKQYETDCPRLTLYLMECPNYVSHQERYRNAMSDPYEK